MTENGHGPPCIGVPCVSFWGDRPTTWTLLKVFFPVSTRLGLGLMDPSLLTRRLPQCLRYQGVC